MSDNKLIALAELCEAATGPDRGLNRDIERARHAGGPFAMATPPYTASIDAAMTLAPEGAAVQLQTHGGPGPMALVAPGEQFIRGATPALALCAAALRAIAA